MKAAVRIYRYIRFRKGFGVHSPFAFGLINKVIEETKPFYIFEEIEKNAAGRHGKLSPQKKYGRLLFRLVNFFHAETVLQIGISDPTWPEYLSAAAKHLIVVDGNHLQAVNNILADTERLDLLFLNVSKDPELTRQLFDRCIAHVHRQTVWVVDGIHKKQMRECWKNLKKRNDVPITMDLYVLGLVFFNSDMYKKNYKLFF
ncbi:MAG: hypothetical protein LBC40_04825 [Dysgonamonadaceae bacterium]|nr:hypothetical protein [Dysgonamonadaceae bacterium]